MSLQVENKNLVIYGKFPRIVRLEDEYFDWVKDPDRFVEELQGKDVEAELFTFVQKGVVDPKPRYHFYHEWDSLAVLQITTYQDWWTNRIRHGERNRVGKALKSKVEVRVVDFDDSFVQGIKEIYDESPLRQGRLFRHYQKPLEVLKQEQGTFRGNSQFIGAFYEGKLIGFVKLLHDEGVCCLMQVISMIKHRDKSVTNALIAKVVETCAEQGVRYLRYGNWCRRGLGDFKRNQAFEKVDVPRYYVPLNLAGKFSLGLRLHRDIAELFPEKWVDAAIALRNRLNERRYLSQHSTQWQ